jgi:hypothetical protein
MRKFSDFGLVFLIFFFKLHFFCFVKSDLLFLNENEAATNVTAIANRTNILSSLLNKTADFFSFNNSLIIKEGFIESDIFMYIVLNDLNKENSFSSDAWLVEGNKPTRLLLVGNENLNRFDRITFSKISKSRKFAEENSIRIECLPALDEFFEIKILLKSEHITLAESYIKLPSLAYSNAYNFWSDQSDSYFLCIQSRNKSNTPVSRDESEHDGIYSFYYPSSLLVKSTRIQVFQDYLPDWLKIVFALIGFIGSFYFSGLALGIYYLNI